MGRKTIILGAGMTGLAAGVASGFSVFEAGDRPGGICSSYYMRPHSVERLKESDRENNTYRFELGGGHWIFGGDDKILNFINSLSPTKVYERKSAVYFPDLDLYVPYTLQNHLFYLPEEIRKKVLREIIKSENKAVSILADWLELNFGKTLCELFFFPFHELYTAGLYTEIAPQDKFKTPVNKDLILKGAKGKTSPVGYNATFVYPEKGLNDLIRKMSKKCKINYNKKVIKINSKEKEIIFEDGNGVKYEKIISTLPLNKVIEMTGIEIDEKSAPFTSVLVINIGAKKGKKCPDYHWIYIPKSKAGFHRVGFYSNVDNSFLPESLRKNNDIVSVYIEKAYLGGSRPKNEAIRKLCNDIVRELHDWEFITQPEVVDLTWIDVAYTWSYPNSKWKQKAIELLTQNGIYQIGRYGVWEFQGIAKSIKDGLEIKYGR